MKLGRDIYGWPWVECGRLTIVISPDWYWHPEPMVDDYDWPTVEHMFYGFIGISWIIR